MEENKKHIGFQIRKTAHAIKRYVDWRLKDAGVNLSGVEGMAIAFIERNEGQMLTAKTFMDTFRTSKATTSQTLAGLVKKGVIEYKPYPKDKRIKVIVLTDKGRQWTGNIKETLEAAEQSFLDELSQEQLHELTEILEKIRENVKSEMGDDTNEECD